MAAAAPDEAASEERQLAKERKGSTKKAAVRSDAKVCRRPTAAEGLSATFSCFPKGYTLFFSANGDGAPPQAHIHLNLGCTPSGSPRTKFGPKCNGRNRHIGSLSTMLLRFMGNPLKDVHQTLAPGHVITLSKNSDRGV